MCMIFVMSVELLLMVMSLSWEVYLELIVTPPDLSGVGLMLIL